MNKNDDEYFKTTTGTSNASLLKATGKDWNAWVQVLDDNKANTLNHTEIAKLLNDRYIKSSWWSQMVTVGYEKIKGLREQHEKRNGYEISVSKTLNISSARLDTAFFNDEERKKWFKENITIRTHHKNKSIRFIWNDDNSTVQVNFYPINEKKTKIVVQHSKLTSAKSVEKLKKFWQVKLTELSKLLEK